MYLILSIWRGSNSFCSCLLPLLRIFSLSNRLALLTILWHNIQLWAFVIVKDRSAFWITLDFLFTALLSGFFCLMITPKCLTFFSSIDQNTWPLFCSILPKWGIINFIAPWKFKNINRKFCSHNISIQSSWQRADLLCVAQFKMYFTKYFKRK